MSDFSTPIQHFPNAQADFDIPQLAQSNVFLGDITGAEASASSPVSCGFFRIKAGEPLVGKYPYQETLLILSGSIKLTDGAGVTSIGTKGDVYYFPAGSMVTFSTDDEGFAFYTVQRAKK